MGYDATMRTVILFACLTALAACAAPHDVCVQQATRDLNIVRDLISDTEATLARGYAIQSQTRAVLYTDFCIGAGRHSGRHGGRFQFCNRVEPVTTREPVAVDLDAERRKLRSLKRKEAELTREAELAVRQCALAHPPQS
jgi:hypothetical protein